MSDTLETLRRKIDGAGELDSVVRSMKALAAASIGKYEKAVPSLADYYRRVELGLAACRYTGRLPKAKLLDRELSIESNIWWGRGNHGHSVVTATDSDRST